MPLVGSGSHAGAPREAWAAQCSQVVVGRTVLSVSNVERGGLPQSGRPRRRWAHRQQLREETTRSLAWNETELAVASFAKLFLV